jgi:hypothetical protein
MTRLTCLRQFLLLLTLALSGAAHGLSLHRDGGDLYASGIIVQGDELALQAAHQSEPVRRLILVNSPGGALITSLRIARWLEALRITTVAWGPCMSACSLIFMAGEQRQFAQDGAGRPSVIGIHGPYNSRTGQFSTAAAPLMLDYYRHRMGARFDAEVIERAGIGEAVNPRNPEELKAAMVRMLKKRMKGPFEGLAVFSRKEFRIRVARMLEEFWLR